MKTDILMGAFAAIAKVVPYTLFTALVIMLAAICLGAVFALVRIKKIKIVSTVLGWLIGYVRGTPMIVQMFITYYSLPYAIAYVANTFFGMDLKYFDIPGIVTIYFSFILCQAGYQCEVIRGALSSIERGQMEAGYAVGMSERQTLMRIVFPQALSVALPSFFTHYMSTVKLLSLGFTLQVVDIMAAAKLYTAMTERYTESYLAAAVIYWVIGLCLTAIFHRWEMYSKRALGTAR